MHYFVFSFSEIKNIGYMCFFKMGFLRVRSCCFYLLVLIFHGLTISKLIAINFPEVKEILPENRGTFRGRPVIKAVRVDEGPSIDGIVTDDVWLKAQPGGKLIQVSPKEKTPQSEPTEFRILYDDDALYIGVWCYDSKPNELVMLTMDRDQSMRFDDNIYISLDTFFDRRNGYVFSVNPNGARRDGAVSNNGYGGDEWDGAWSAKSKVHSWGWAAELAIPFKTLSFDANSKNWGFNISRNIGRLGERSIWANARSEVYPHHLSEAGNLTGLNGIKQGLGLDVNPYTIGKYRKDYEKDDSDLLGDAGFDIRYRLTPNLTALASVNTDFAETEIDRRQVNLTRYPLFFPEKRQFFLEDSGIFAFGGAESASRRKSSSSAGGLMMPFFSRRIGLSSSGEVTPIHFAGKVTGRVKDYNIGMLDAVLDSDDGLRNVFVGRISKNIFEQSSMGFLTTIGDPNSDTMNAVTGLDFQYRNSNLLGGKTLVANIYTLGTYSEDHSGFNSAWGAEAKLFDRNLDFSASVTEIDDEFKPAMGFVRRRGVRRYQLEADYIPYHDSISWLRNTRHGYEAEINTDLGNDVVDTDQSFAIGSFYLESQDIISLKVHHVSDRPNEDFHIADGTMIPTGRYDWWETRLYGFFGMNRPLFFAPSIRLGGFYDGISQRYGLETRYVPWAKLTVGADYSVTYIDWDYFDESQIKMITGTLKYSFTPDLVFSNLVQYDNVSESMGVNSRLQWEYKPGSKFFIVVNQGYVDEKTGLMMRDFELVAKLGALFRF